MTEEVVKTLVILSLVVIFIFCDTSIYILRVLDYRIENVDAPFECGELTECQLYINAFGIT